MLLFTHTIAQMLKARCKFSVPAVTLAQTFVIARPAAHIFVTAFSCFGTMPAAPEVARFEPRLVRWRQADSRRDRSEVRARHVDSLSGPEPEKQLP
jgi:hypothetical protein